MTSVAHLPDAAESETEVRRARVAELEAAIERNVGRRLASAVDYEPPPEPVYEPLDLASALRDASEALGFEAPSAAPTGRPRWCAEPGCGRVVPPGEGLQLGSTLRCGECAAKSRAAARRRRLVAALSTMPPHFAWARIERGGDLERHVGAPALERAVAWLREPKRPTLSFQGETGAGKTACGVALLRRLLDRAERPDAPDEFVRYAAGVRYVPAFELARAREGHPLGKGEAPLIAEAKRATVLLLDDLGGEGRSISDAVGDVIHKRHDLAALTIVTTGLDEAGLETRYGVGIRRRVLTDATQILLRPQAAPAPPQGPAPPSSIRALRLAYRLARPALAGARRAAPTPALGPTDVPRSEC
ncbi:MAG: hypothetical protein MUF34_34005 [Polyangiaceae bacterium]|jgi:DNA replication protein DnaC|nr:hypothetical protein [Polyangiaceae bacterium]